MPVEKFDHLRVAQIREEIAEYAKKQGHPIPRVFLVLVKPHGIAYETPGHPANAYAKKKANEENEKYKTLGITGKVYE